jgi:probable H4MPT-linked C1 transfer pathway protein
MPFALWREPAGLAGAVGRLIESAPATQRLAVTMTGELCDCFGTKAEGVRHILTALQQAAAARDIRVYLVDGRLATLAEARESPHLAAASNWHALARFACRYVAADAGLLIDVGSTTTDIVPLVGGRPQPEGLDDTTRLMAGELVYTGVGRTPVCAIARELPWRDGHCPVAAELFATAADAYVVLGELPEQPKADWTADGRPLTKEFSRRRLARMICADAPGFTMADALRAAAAVRDAQAEQVREAAARRVGCLGRIVKTIVVSGAGEFLAREVGHKVLPRAEIVSLSQELGAAASRAAPAHALAVLATEGG